MQVQKLFLLFVLIFLNSCSTNKLITNFTADIIKQGSIVYYQEDDLELVKYSLPGNIKLLEVFHINSPYNKDLNTMLAESYGAYGFFLYATGEKNKERIIKFHNRGIKYAKYIFSKSENITARDLIEKINKSNRIDTMFWLAFNISMLIDLDKTSLDALVYLPVLTSLLDRILNKTKNDNLLGIEKYFFRTLAVGLKSGLSCSVPKQFGGAPQEAQEYLEKSIKNNPDLLVLKLIYLEKCNHLLSQDKKYELYEGFEQKISNKDTNNRFIFLNKLALERFNLIKTSL